MHGVRLGAASLHGIHALEAHLFGDANGCSEVESFRIPFDMADRLSKRVHQAQSAFCVFLVPEITYIGICINAGFFDDLYQRIDRSLSSGLQDDRNPLCGAVTASCLSASIAGVRSPSNSAP